MLTGQKHRWIAAAHNNLAAYRFALFQQLDLHDRLIGVRLDDHTISRRA
jgi:hypothetical protein